MQTELAKVLRHSCLIPAMAFAVLPVAAQSEQGAGDWDYLGSIYLWGAGIEGTTENGSTIDVGFEDLLQNLNFAFMGSLEGRKGDWSFLGDVVYMDVGADDNGSIVVNPGPGPGVPVETGADVRVKGWILSLFGGYTVARTERSVVDLIGGLRYLDIDTRLRGQISVGPVTNPVRVDAGYSALDVVAGFRGRTDLGDKWFATYHADIGTGESDVTWQLAGGVGYRFDWGEVSLSYRHIEWESDGDTAIDSINFSGPLLSAGFRF